MSLFEMSRQLRMLRISVIIPVYNDTERLRHCLAALEAQTYPASRYDVIVVDNGSARPLELGTSYPHAQLAHERRAGSYAARNTGIVLSAGDVLAFTDSDCVPAPNWLEEAARALERLGGRGIVVGRIDQVPARAGQLSLVELYGSVFWLRQQHYAEKGGFGATANLVTSRRVMEKIGLFDAALRSGGDEDWCLRGRAAGVPLVSAHAAAVSHPTVRNLHELATKSRRVVGGHMQRRRRGSYSTRDLLRDVRLDIRPGIKRRRRFLKQSWPELAPGRLAAMTALIALLQLLRALERFRLFFGGEPQRR